MKPVFALALAFIPYIIYGQDEATIWRIKHDLSVIRDRDQKIRKGTDSAQYRAYIDSSNLACVEAIINQYGWLGKSIIGPRANNTLFLVIQHAGLETQVKYLPLLRKSVSDSGSYACDLALLEDRVLMRQDKKQVYGSQVVFNKTTGAQEFWPIEDEKNVNARRAKVGLEPLEQYAKFFGIEYKPVTD